MGRVQYRECVVYTALVMAPDVDTHHNYPCSRGGGEVRHNLSRLRRSRHDGFHMWAWNYPPDAILRFLAEHGVQRPEGTLPAGALEDVLGKLTEDNWTALYKPGVVTGGHTPGQREKAHHFLIHHLNDERNDVRRLIGALTLGEGLPWERHLFLERALVFFRTAMPREAMRNFLTESYGSELSWAKALRDDVRRSLLDILSYAEGACDSGRERQRVIDILLVQERHLLQCLMQELQEE